MDQPLLGSKLHIPVSQTDIVKRPSLLKKLGTDHINKLILISAPAGFGKSTTAANWIRETGLPAAWLSLESSDNDPVRFLQYLIAALQNVDPSLDDSALVFFQSPGSSALDTALTVLVSQIEGIESDFILVLDDYHLIRENAVHQILAFLIEHQPQCMHTAILTRADPPLALGKLRAVMQLTEIRSQDLRFSPDEAREFMSKAIEAQIADRDLYRLVERTEGWISGLQMAALSMAGKGDISGFVDSFSGSHRYVLDYLMEEVLSGQSQEMRDFLFRTSILDRFCAPLCSAVSGFPAAQEMLAELEQSNMFIIALDDVRRWYRYHRLFSDFLQTRLEEKYPVQVGELHMKASRWYEGNYLISQAVEHALRAPDYERAAGLIEREAEKKLIRSEISTLLHWIESLPTVIRNNNPVLAFYALWAQMLARYQFEDILQELDNLENSQEIPPGWRDALLAFIEISRADMDAGQKYAQKALESLQEDDVYFRIISLWCLGLSRVVNQNLEDSYRVLEELLEVSRSQNNVMFMVMTAGNMARVRMRQGKLEESEKIYLQALEMGKTRRGDLLPIAGEILMGLGDLYRELDELDKAVENLLQGIKLTKQWRDAAAMEGYIYLARVNDAQKAPEAAQDALERARQLARKYDAIDVDDRMVLMEQARFWITQGRLDRALDWVQSLESIQLENLDWDPDSAGFEYMMRIREAVVLSRFFTVKGDYPRAINLIERLKPAFESLGKTDTVIELFLLKVKVLKGMGEDNRAIEEMKKAISNARGTGFKRLFLDEGQAVLEMLRIPEIRACAPKLVDGLLEKPDISQPKGSVSAQLLPEALSERELEVLRYLRTNLTTPEIAEEMVLGVNTVRTHIKNIYSKLNVHKRFDAVKRGRELGLI